MDNINIIELLDDLRGILVRSIEAEGQRQHEVAARLLAQAVDKIDQRKKLLESSSSMSA
jgi:hypothetical protein